MYSYPFPMVSSTVTLVVVNKDTNQILLGKRSADSDAYPDYWSLPGGFLDAKTKTTPGEDSQSTCVRELYEETNIKIDNKYRFVLFGSTSDPNLDPRAHVINLHYLIEVSNEDIVDSKAGDDLQELKWASMDDRDQFMDLSFNHTEIVLDAISFYAKIKPGRYQRNNVETSALAVVRIQPLHNGHIKMITDMISSYDNVIIGVGSSDKPVSDKNPWTFTERKSMLRRVFGSRIKIIPIDDIGEEENENSWCDHVLNTLLKVNIDKPDVYYSGSDYDSNWYKGRFGNNIVVINRDENDHISGTDIRKSILSGTNLWKEHTPLVNKSFIEDYMNRK